MTFITENGLRNILVKYGHKVIKHDVQLNTQDQYLCKLTVQNLTDCDGIYKPDNKPCRIILVILTLGVIRYHKPFVILHTRHKMLLLIEFL